MSNQYDDDNEVYDADFAEISMMTTTKFMTRILRR